MCVPDNYSLWVQHDQESDDWLRNRPVCDCCREHIQDESYHRICGERICDRCLDGMIEYVED